MASIENKNAYTPILRQYLEQKERAEGALLLFRLGDFYEAFFEDAQILAQELEIALTSRADSAHPSGRVPMAGIPCRAADSYIPKLLAAGLKVAVSEQIGEALGGKGPMQREIAKILTPGTIPDGELLRSDAANYLLACTPAASSGFWGVAYVEVSTGELRFGELSEDELLQRVACLKPSEILAHSQPVSSKLAPLDDQLVLPVALSTNSKICLTRRREGSFSASAARERLAELFGQFALEGLVRDPSESALEALGAVLSYLAITSPGSLRSLRQLELIQASASFLSLDEQTLRNLEIFESLSLREKRGSLYHLFEAELSTKVGSRLLKEWLAAPLLSLPAIENRLNRVQALKENPKAKNKLKETLRGFSDLERLTVKLLGERLNPRELGWLRDSLRRLPALAQILETIGFEGELACSEELDRNIQTCWLALQESLPVVSSAGGIFQAGYNAELDDFRELIAGNEAWLQALESKEREKPGLKTLKVVASSNAGFYLELTKTASKSAPPEYQIKQNLTNQDRYTIPELSAREQGFLQAQNNQNALEESLFIALRASLIPFAEELRTIAGIVAGWDCLQAFASLAEAGDYTRPSLSATSQSICLTEARHPCLEALLPPGVFVPNDLSLVGGLEGSEASLILLTGPNMAGKSTYMKQAAIIALLAQCGSFVPAKRAELGILDRIFTRIGASDDPSSGRSTFMVEMTETAFLLNNLTERSLVLLDEVGRGTSTFDGVALAWSVAEYLLKQGVKTIFATHYHELSGLADLYPKAANYQLLAEEKDGDLVFLHKVASGAAEKSYGIEVARLAGLPRQVLERAKGLLASLNERGVKQINRSSLKQTAGDLQLALEFI